VSAFAWIVLAVIAALLGAEVIAWCPPLQRLLLRRAAAALPEAHRERYLEEWTAELNELPNGPITRLLFATSLLLRRGGVARELSATAPAHARGAAIAPEDPRAEQQLNADGEQTMMWIITDDLEEFGNAAAHRQWKVVTLDRIAERGLLWMAWDELRVRGGKRSK
jgi:hypothetical protein